MLYVLAIEIPQLTQSVSTFSRTITDSKSRLPIRFHWDMRSLVLETSKLLLPAMYQENGPRRREFPYSLSGHRVPVLPSPPLSMPRRHPSPCCTGLQLKPLWIQIPDIHTLNIKCTAVSAQVFPLGKSRPTDLDGKHVSVSAIPIL